MGNNPVEIEKYPVDSNEALQFIRALFEDMPEDTRMLLWQKRKPTIWIDNVEQIKFSDPNSRPRDLYVGCGLVPASHVRSLRRIRGGAYKRCPIKKISGIPGLWADFDIEPGKIPDQQTAHKILEKLPPSTVIVDSGHGLHIWWLFKELWIFDDDKERRAAIHLSKAWSQYLKEVAGQLNCSLDSVPDLSRVLRVPGTLNNKNKKNPVPVRLTKLDDNKRYIPEDFEDLTDHIVIPVRRKTNTSNRKYSKAPSDKLTDAELIEKMFASVKGKKIRKLFEGDISEYKNDNSAADMALCNELGWWTNYNSARMDKLFRQSKLMRSKWDEKHFSDPPFTYGERTIDNVCKDKKRGIDGFGVSQNSINPVIVVNRQLKEIMSDTWDLVHQVNKAAKCPIIYLRHGQLVRIRQDMTPETIELLSKDSVTTFLFNHADWVVETKEFIKPARPPREIVASLISDPNIKIPQLELLETVPFFSKDGQLIQKEGYYQDLKVWLKLSSDLENISVPENPTPQEVETAVSLFMDDLLVDFPFVSQADRANCIGAFILPFVRSMIDDVTPLQLFEAPTPGSGKGLLSSLLSLLCSGEEVVIQVFTYQEEELRKRVSSELLKGRPIIAFDNADTRRKLHSPALAAILTARVWGDRELGRNSDITVVNNAIWVMTGNNMEVSSELADRMVRIRIDPKIERPRDRDPRKFKHHPIKQWVRQNRKQLVTAALTLAQAWINAGMPFSGKEYGSFERWSRIIGGILENAGIKDFLVNRNEFFEQADQEMKMWHDFVNAWWVEFGDSAVQAKQLNELCENQELMLTIRRDGNERSQVSLLGRALKSARDSVKGKYMIEANAYVQNNSGSPRNNGYKLTTIEEEDDHRGEYVDLNDEFIESQEPEEELPF